MFIDCYSRCGFGKSPRCGIWILATKDEAYYDVFNVGTGRKFRYYSSSPLLKGVNNLKLNYEIGPRRPGREKSTTAT
jgi:UDP-glucose 4-epimerase